MLLPIRTRMQSLTHLEQFTSFINISDFSLGRCFVPKSEELVSEGIFSTVSLLLRTASWRDKGKATELCTCRTAGRVKKNYTG